MRQDSVQWQDIFILASKHSSWEAAQQFAEDLAAKARQGADFVKLCLNSTMGSVPTGKPRDWAVTVARSSLRRSKASSFA